MKTIFKCVLLASTTILLSACGGGGGGVETSVTPEPKPAITIESGLYSVNGQDAFLMVSQPDNTNPAILSYRNLSNKDVDRKTLVSFGLLHDKKMKITDQRFRVMMGHFKDQDTQAVGERAVFQINITGTSPLSLEWKYHFNDENGNRKDYSDSLGDITRIGLQDFPLTSVAGTWEDNNDVRMTIDNSNVEISIPSSKSSCTVTGKLVKGAGRGILDVSTTYSIDNINVTPDKCNGIDSLVMMSQDFNWFVTLNNKNGVGELHKLIQTSK